VNGIIQGPFACGSRHVKGVGLNLTSATDKERYPAGYESSIVISAPLTVTAAANNAYRSATWHLERTPEAIS
jgi:hypothetical protein